MPEPPKLWVPMPASKAYGREPESIRDRFVREYGASTVTQAELQTCIDLLILTGAVKPAEFVEILTNKLQRVDRLRREAAGVPD